MGHLHDLKVAATPSGVQTGMNRIQGKKQDKERQVKV
jgi:hypothetical protein